MNFTKRLTHLHQRSCKARCSYSLGEPSHCYCNHYSALAAALCWVCEDHCSIRSLTQNVCRSVPVCYANWYSPNHACRTRPVNMTAAVFSHIACKACRTAVQDWKMSGLELSYRASNSSKRCTVFRSTYCLLMRTGNNALLHCYST
jgi:hypothetical protein